MCGAYDVRFTPGDKASDVGPPQTTASSFTYTAFTSRCQQTAL